MISYQDATFEQLSIHRVGNKLMNESYNLSEYPVVIEDAELKELILQFLLSPFEKVSQVFRLSHPTEKLSLNEIFHFADLIFNKPDTFHENSRQISKHLYDITGHAKIKSGEVYITYFKSLQVEGNLHDAIGIFKSENKETYLKTFPEKNGFGIKYEKEAINIRKLDKGCLIFNTEKKQGYKVLVIDQTNNSESVYWIDDFLKLKIRDDAYSKTYATLNLYKNFVTEKLGEEFELTKADKIDLLNRSMKYFKEKEHFNVSEFANEVIGEPQGVKLFDTYRKSYEKEFDTNFENTFEISGAAVKKQSKQFKSILKLDKNFHIYIHGNKDLIEKGFDRQKNMNYYKMYFKEEQ